MQKETNINTPLEEFFERIITKAVRDEFEKIAAQINPSKEEQDLIYIDEACRITGYKRQTIYGYVNDNKIPYHPKNGRKPLAFSRKELIAWREGRK